MKKTYIDTIIRVISGITGILLNIILIMKLGLIGLGIATLLGNILYFVLSVIITVPDLKWDIPYAKIFKILFCFVPVGILYVIFRKLQMHYGVQMLLLSLIYAYTYAVIQKFFPDAYVE